MREVQKAGKSYTEIAETVNKDSYRTASGGKFHKIAVHRLCLYYANHTCATLWKHGHQAVIQVGSLQWPRVRHEEDDGQMNTHFAYEWSPCDPESAVRRNGQPPRDARLGWDRGQPGDRGLQHEAPEASSPGPGDGLVGSRSAEVPLVPGERAAGLGGSSEAPRRVSVDGDPDGMRVVASRPRTDLVLGLVCFSDVPSA